MEKHFQTDGGKEVATALGAKYSSTAFTKYKLQKVMGRNQKGKILQLIQGKKNNTAFHRNI